MRSPSLSTAVSVAGLRNLSTIYQLLKHLAAGGISAAYYKASLIIIEFQNTMFCELIDCVVFVLHGATRFIDKSKIWHGLIS